MITALAFIPPDDIYDAVSVLRGVLPAELQIVLDHFEDFYIGRWTAQTDGSFARRTPMFPLETWTVHERTLQHDSRTNNFAEAHHRSLQRQFQVHHPALLKFIDGLREVQQAKDAELERYVAGRDPQNKRNRYLENDERVLKILERMPHCTLEETLRGIAHTYLMDP